MRAQPRARASLQMPRAVPGSCCVQVIDLAVHAPGLDLLSSPTWLYDTRFCSNVWGNR